MALLLSGTRIYGTGTVDTQLFVNGTTAATSTTTGALQVVGGIGLGGTLYAGGGISGNLIGGSTGALVYQSSTSTTAFLTVGSSGQVLSVNSGVPTWTSIGSLTAGQATTATHLSGGTAGQIPYQTSPGQTSFFGAGTTGSVLVSYGSAGTPTFQNTLTLAGTTAASSTTTGALQVVGGVGVGGTLYVGGNSNIAGNEIITGDLAVNGGDITTNQSSFNLIYTTATTVNFAGAATTLNMGASLSGSTNVRNNLVVSGNLTIQGTTTIVDSTVTNIADPIITLGGGSSNSAPTADDNKDRGIAFKYVNNAGSTSTGFFGYKDSTGFFTYVATATITNEVITGTKGAIDVNLAGGTAMSLVYQSAADTTQFLDAGSSGQVLQTNGTGSAPTWVATSSLGAGSATYADSVRTIRSTSNATFYPTFVDSNNASNTYESVYTTSSFSINAATGLVTISGASGDGTPILRVTGTTAPASGFNWAGSFMNSSLTTSKNTVILIGQAESTKNSGYIGFNYAGSSGSNSSFMTIGLYANDNILNVTGAGYVGIGTTSPTNKFVVSNSGAAGLEISPTGGLSSGPAVISYNRSGAAYTPITSYALNYAWYVGTGGSTRAVDITINGGIAFGGSANYGSSGQILQSNGDAAPTWINTSALTSGNSTTATNADALKTIASTTNANFYPSFVDSNNSTAAYEAHYTTSTFAINPATGAVSINGVGGTALNLSVPSSATDRYFLNGTAAVNSFSIYDNSNTPYINSYASMAFRANQIGGSGGHFYFSGGNVMIGSGTPGAPLSFTDATGVKIQLNANAGNYYTLEKQAAVNSGDSMFKYNAGQTSAGEHGFYSGGTLRVLINATGSVGIATSAPTAKLHVVGNTIISGNAVIGATTTTNKFEVVGTAGQLFSVSDSFTGTIFAASDVSGIPSIEVLDTGLVKLAQYSGQVAISTSTIQTNMGLTVNTATYITSLGVGTVASGTLGEIRAANEITAYYSSDARLKENIKVIENPITIIDQIRGVYFDWTDEHMASRGGEDGYFVRKHDMGVIAQEVQAVLPELVGTRADGYLAVKYEKLVPLLIEAIKEQQKTISVLIEDLDTIKEFINDLKNKNGI